MKKHLTTEKTNARDFLTARDTRHFLRRGFLTAWAAMAFLGATLFESATAEDIFTARVVSVHDGDTITVELANHERRTIRLALIDAPELKQPGGEEAQHALYKAVAALNVEVRPTATDLYSRTVAMIYREQTNVNLEAVKNGHAWCYTLFLKRENLKTQTEFMNAEVEARKTRSGLWSLANPEPPWVFRHKAKATH